MAPKPKYLPTDEEIAKAAEVFDIFLTIGLYEQYHLFEKFDIHPENFRRYMVDVNKRFTKT